MIHIIFLQDYSYSMVGHIPKVVHIINTFLTTLMKNRGDVVFSIASFSDKLRWIQKNSANPIPIKEDDFKNAGMTALYDSVCQVLLEYGVHTPDKKILYIITDGDDNSSYKFKREYTDDLCKQATTMGNWEIKHFDTLNYQTLSVPTIKFDIDDLSELFNHMQV